MLLQPCWMRFFQWLKQEQPATKSFRSRAAIRTTRDWRSTIRRLLATFRLIEQTGLPVVVHPFVQTIFEQLSEEAFASGRPRDIWTFSDIYTRDIVWRTAVGILLDLARETACDCMSCTLMHRPA